MRVKTEQEGGALTAFLSGEIDHHSAREMREQIDYSVERGAAKALRLDFSGVTFMDSSGVGLILGRYKLMQANGGTLRICGTPQTLKRMMVLAGLDRLPIWEKKEEKKV